MLWHLTPGSLVPVDKHLTRRTPGAAEASRAAYSAGESVTWWVLHHPLGDNFPGQPGKPAAPLSHPAGRR